MKFILLSAVLALAAPRPALAAPDAKGVIQAFDSGLLDIMKNADKLKYQGRYQKFEPLVEQTFDLPLMARISVGPQWATLSADDQAKIVEAFKRLSIATYASRFDGYGGEDFQIVGETPSAGDDQVNTKLIRPRDTPVDLNYRLRQDGGNWKVIDVYLSGTISQLANYRSEFAAALRSKGAEGLVALIDKKVADLAPKS